MSDPYEYDDGNPYAPPPLGDLDPPPVEFTEKERAVFRTLLKYVFTSAGWGLGFLVVAVSLANMQSNPIGFADVAVIIAFVCAFTFSLVAAVGVFRLSRMLGRSRLLSGFCAYISVNPGIALLAVLELRYHFHEILKQSETPEPKTHG